MINYSKKIAQALTIIRKYYGAINVQRTDNEDVVYLFDYTTQKKTIGSEKINKAVEKAVKQNDFPKDIYYSYCLLSLIKIEEKIVEEENSKETFLKRKDEYLKKNMERPEQDS